MPFSIWSELANWDGSLRTSRGALQSSQSQVSATSESMALNVPGVENTSRGGEEGSMDVDPPLDVPQSILRTQSDALSDQTPTGVAPSSSAASPPSSKMPSTPLSVSPTQSMIIERDSLATVEEQPPPRLASADPTLTERDAEGSTDHEEGALFAPSHTISSAGPEIRPHDRPRAQTSKRGRPRGGMSSSTRPAPPNPTQRRCYIEIPPLTQDIDKAEYKRYPIPKKRKVGRPRTRPAVPGARAFVTVGDALAAALHHNNQTTTGATTSFVNFSNVSMSASAISSKKRKYTTTDKGKGKGKAPARAGNLSGDENSTSEDDSATLVRPPKKARLQDPKPTPSLAKGTTGTVVHFDLTDDDDNDSVIPIRSPKKKARLQNARPAPSASRGPSSVLVHFDLTNVEDEDSVSHVRPRKKAEQKATSSLPQETTDVLRYFDLDLSPAKSSVHPTVLIATLRHLWNPHTNATQYKAFKDLQTQLMVSPSSFPSILASKPMAGLGGLFRPIVVEESDDDIELVEYLMEEPKLKPRSKPGPKPKSKPGPKPRSKPGPKPRPKPTSKAKPQKRRALGEGHDSDRYVSATPDIRGSSDSDEGQDPVLLPSGGDAGGKAVSPPGPARPVLPDAEHDIIRYINDSPMKPKPTSSSAVPSGEITASQALHPHPHLGLAGGAEDVPTEPETSLEDASAGIRDAYLVCINPWAVGVEPQEAYSVEGTIDPSLLGGGGPPTIDPREPSHSPTLSLLQRRDSEGQVASSSRMERAATATTTTASGGTESDDDDVSLVERASERRVRRPAFRPDMVAVDELDLSASSMTSESESESDTSEPSSSPLSGISAPVKVPRRKRKVKPQPRPSVTGAALKTRRARIALLVRVAAGEVDKDTIVPEKMTERESFSCHHCKSRSNRLKLRCSSVVDDEGGVCGKPYCWRCLVYRYPGITFDHLEKTFVCPSCKDICHCAACRRKRGDTSDPPRIVLFGGRRKKPVLPDIKFTGTPTALSSTKYFGAVYGLYGERLGTAYGEGRQVIVAREMQRSGRGNPKERVFAGAAQDWWGPGSGKKVDENFGGQSLALLPDAAGTESGKGKGKAKAVVRTYAGKRSSLFAPLLFGDNAQPHFGSSMESSPGSGENNLFWTQDHLGDRDDDDIGGEQVVYQDSWPADYTASYDGYEYGWMSQDEMTIYEPPLQTGLDEVAVEKAIRAALGAII